MGGWLVGFFGMFELVVGGLGFEEQGALVIFPDAENDERDYGGGGPEFCVARDFGFGLPAEELGGGITHSTRSGVADLAFDSDVALRSSPHAYKRWPLFVTQRPVARSARPCPAA